MKSANDNEVNDDVGARELYDEMDIRFPNLFFSPPMDFSDQHQSGLAVQHDRQVIEGMRERKFGRIINISSINGQKGPVRPDQLFGREAGEIGFTKTLAQEGARLGVTVNAIAPGYINTEMVQAVPKEVLENILPTIPIGRRGEPEEIGRCVVFLASDDAGLITGSTLTANGGQYIT